MCPNRQILSVYYDRELPSPWKEKMEVHLAACPECREALSKIEGLSAAMRENPAYRTGFSAEEAGERVWSRLVRSGGTPHPVIRREILPRRRVWDRSVTIPLPAVVAAAALLVFAFTLILVNQPSIPNGIPDAAAFASLDLDMPGVDMPGIIPVSNMNDVLQYLGQDNSGTDFMIIRLPETKHFMSAGEPAIIRAADYSRRTGNQ
jgi:hypothetical protein